MKLAALTLAAVAAVALAGVTRAEDAPMLGATISPAKAIYEDTPYLRVDSRATVPVVMTIEVTGGYKLAETSLNLAPGEWTEIPYVEAGPDNGDVTVTMRAAEAVPGVDQTTVILATTIRHLTPVERLQREYGSAIFLVPLLVVALLALLVLALARRRLAGTRA